MSIASRLQIIIGYIYIGLEYDWEHNGINHQAEDFVWDFLIGSSYVTQENTTKKYIENSIKKKHGDVGYNMGYNMGHLGGILVNIYGISWNTKLSAQFFEIVTVNVCNVLCMHMCVYKYIYI